MTLPVIIGLCGRAGVGKDTAADFLIESYPQYCKRSFADPIKEMLAVGLGLSHSQLHGLAKNDMDQRYGKTAREIMQTLGTEWGRKMINPDIWLTTMRGRIKGHTVIPDVRFEDEAELIRDMGGLIIHVAARESAIAGTKYAAHASENGIAQHEHDYQIVNNGTLGQLDDEICHILEMHT